MFVLRQQPPVSIGQIKSQPTKLGTTAAVRRALETMLRGIAATAVTDTQSAMNKRFERNAHRFRNLANLLQRKFSRHHQTGETGSLQQSRLLRRGDVGLRGGMKRNWGKRHGQIGEVLHDERIGACFINLLDQRLGTLQLVVEENRVEGHIDLRAEGVGEATKAFNVCHAVAGCGACPEARTADIDSVGTVAHGFDADVSSACRREKFNGSHGNLSVKFKNRLWD